MIKLARCFVPFLLLAFFNQLPGQYLVEQVDYEIPISYSLVPEDAEFNSEEEEKEFFLSLPVDKLKDAAMADGMEVTEIKSTTYMDGDKFAFETESEEMGKTTVVADAKTGIFYMILWTQKKVVVTKPEDMAQMKKDSEALADKMMQGLSPEMREQVKAEMEKEKSPEKYNVQATGKQKNISGFECREYRIEGEDEVVIIWAADDKFGISGEVERISTKFSEIMNMGSEAEDADEWEYIPGKIPVQVQILETGMISEPLVSYQIINKIENKKPSSEKFRVPGKSEGFTHMSMMDMMKAIPGFE